MPYFDEPAETLSDPAELLLAYIDAYRTCVEAKIADLATLSEAELRTSRLPSGWTPLELVKHLAYMERRWFEWGFAGVDVADPFGDDDPSRERWQVRADESAAELLTMLRAVGERTHEILAGNELSDIASAAGRFAGRQPPPLSWIMCHVLQEYARHVGHLDIACELAGASGGE